jgi:putative ABC transport system permease protein
MTSYITLTYADLALASIFLFLNGALSIWLQLGLERQLLIAATRMIVQLLMVGLVLKIVFTTGSPGLTFAIACVMIAFAGREIWARQQRRLRGAWGFGIGATAMMATGSIVTVFALVFQIEPTPWWSPQFALPLFGMILGNTMTGVSLSLDTLHSLLYRESRAIEARLLLGHSRLEALMPFMRQSLRSGFMPIINSMSATGVVSLPGMMTGQILSGVDPNEAVKYQLMVMFLIGGATGLGVLLSTLASAWRLTDQRHRLRLDRLTNEAS